MNTLITKTTINFKEQYSTYVSSFTDQRRDFLESRLDKINFESIEYISNGKKIT